MPSSINQKIDEITRDSGGSTLTRDARSSALRAFFSTLKNELNVQVKEFKHLKQNQVQKYVDHLKGEGKSVRTIQNNLAHVRAGLRHAGRENFADKILTNQSLGASGASRDGTHRAISAYQVEKARAGLVASGQPGAAAALQLQRELGLRMREAIQSEKSLKSWERSLERCDRVTVTHGTKGGRGRDTGVVDTARALGAVRNALGVVKSQGGRLIPSESLQGACRSYQRSLQAQGLTGELASHSLRCAYAQERFGQHLERMGDRREALAATSVDLGHGDGRGTYVAQVYLAN